MFYSLVLIKSSSGSGNKGGRLTFFPLKILKVNTDCRMGTVLLIIITTSARSECGFQEGAGGGLAICSLDDPVDEDFRG